MLSPPHGTDSDRDNIHLLPLHTASSTATTVTAGMPTDVFPSHRKTTKDGFWITDLTVDIPSSHTAPPHTKGERNGVERAPSRWRTKEFMVYYVVFAVVVPWMVWVPVRLSSRALRPSF